MCSDEQRSELGGKAQANPNPHCHHFLLCLVTASIRGLKTVAVISEVTANRDVKAETSQTQRENLPRLLSQRFF